VGRKGPKFVFITNEYVFETADFFGLISVGTIQGANGPWRRQKKPRSLDVKKKNCGIDGKKNFAGTAGGLKSQKQPFVFRGELGNRGFGLGFVQMRGRRKWSLLEAKAEHRDQVGRMETKLPGGRSNGDGGHLKNHGVFAGKTPAPAGRFFVVFFSTHRGFAQGRTSSQRSGGARAGAVVPTGVKAGGTEKMAHSHLRRTGP